MVYYSYSWWDFINNIEFIIPNTKINKYNYGNFKTISYYLSIATINCASPISTVRIPTTTVNLL